ncbi:MAG TPA: transposase, partial [Terriglobales bacterium]|nr:transposase [Terriglobales bacterium]
SREFVENYGLIAGEDLNVKGLAGGRLAKSVHDAAWSSFIAKLLYKAESADRLLVKVEARGTSQQCPCGAPVPKKLWDRKHHCTVLRVKHDPRPRIGIGNTTARTAPKNLNACNRHGS